MRFLVIGGSEGLGKAVVEHYCGSMSVSRRNGYDINDAGIRLNIAEMSLDFDAVLNHAYCGNESYRASEKQRHKRYQT